ncbi:hypothetical protein KCU91_g16720, partial [Aureobasidium melanogenum]
MRNDEQKKAKHTAAGIPTWSPTVVLIWRSTVLMYGRADGMPSFQLTVAVCACDDILLQYNIHDVPRLDDNNLKCKST